MIAIDVRVVASNSPMNPINNASPSMITCFVADAIPSGLDLLDFNLPSPIVRPPRSISQLQLGSIMTMSIEKTSLISLMKNKNIAKTRFKK